MSLADGSAWEREHQRDVHGRFLPFYVPREMMPQVDEVFYPRLIAEATTKGPGVVFDTVNPVTLRAHQRVNHDRAKDMSERVRIKPLIVSNDDYVVDGNHRWWASVHGNHEWVNVIRLGMTFDRAVTWLRLRPYVYEIKPTTPERN